MTTNQEGRQIAVRSNTSTTYDHNSDWHALFTSAGIAAGPWNARMIAWVNATLSTSYTNLNDAMNAFAIGKGYESFADMNDFTLAATPIVAGNPMGLLLAITYPATP